ncbi:MAG: acyl-CoA dehydrogenase family protein, partial [Alphaproteobacteria bacterium]
MLTPILLAALLGCMLAYHGQAFAAWVFAGIIIFTAWLHHGVMGQEVIFFALFGLYVLAVLVFGIPLLRRNLVSGFAMKIAKGTLPTIGETEKIALDAGTVWWDGDLFSGKPDWQKLLNFKVQPLSKSEQAFLDGSTTTLCAMLDDYKIAQDRDLPPKVWKFIKDNGFFGMVIPKKHGGLGFSAAAHAAVVTK